jgi:hypothetical protein
LSKFLEIIFIESTLIFAVLAGEQEIMVFPKLILVRRAFAGLSRPLRFIPQERVLKITEAYLTGLYVFFIDLTTRARGK